MKRAELLIFYEENPPVTGGLPSQKGLVKQQLFPGHDIIMLFCMYTVPWIHVVTSAHHEEKPTGGLTVGQTNSPSSIVQIARLLFI